MKTPGVYVVELPAGGMGATPDFSHTVTAFLGRVPRGPLNQPIHLSSWEEFEVQCGGLAADQPMTYAVADYFRHGGRDALICRVYSPPAQATNANAIQEKSEAVAAGIAPSAAESNLPKPDPMPGYGRLAFLAPAGGPALVLAAANPGAWAAGLTARIDREDITHEVAATMSAGGGSAVAFEDLFNLTLTLPKATGEPEVEFFPCVALEGPQRRVDHVLAEQSSLCRVQQMGAVDLSAGPQIASADGAADSAAIPISVYLGDQNLRRGMYCLDAVPGFQLLTIPPDAIAGDTDPFVYAAAATYCEARRSTLLVDGPMAWQDRVLGKPAQTMEREDLGSLSPAIASHVAVLFPRLLEPNPLGAGGTIVVAASGAVAGLMSASDRRYGPWTALDGDTGRIQFPPSVPVPETMLAAAAKISANLILPAGAGSRVGMEWTFAAQTPMNVDERSLGWRRLRSQIETDLQNALRWTVFETNNEDLWSSVRLQIDSYLAALVRLGALSDYSVDCGSTTTSPLDVLNGWMIAMVAISPVDKPSLFSEISLRFNIGG